MSSFTKHDKNQQIFGFEIEQNIYCWNISTYYNPIICKYFIRITTENS